MRRLLIAVGVASVLAGCQTPTAPFDPQTIISMERAALDRWGKGDPQGYVEIYASDMTYFDPMQDKRIDGLDAMKRMLAPLTGKVSLSRYEMIDPRVQHHGDVALLTFNLISYQKQTDGSERAVARWNSTETYARLDGQWRIIHSHWSYTKPQLRQPTSEEGPTGNRSGG